MLSHEYKYKFNNYDIISKCDITGLYHGQINTVLGTHFMLQNKINIL